MVEKKGGGLGHIEERLLDLDKQVGIKLDVLKTITASDVKSNPPKASRITPEMKDKVHFLKRAGWKDEEIASRTQLSLGEVQMILDTPSDIDI